MSSAPRMTAPRFAVPLLVAIVAAPLLVASCSPTSDAPTPTPEWESRSVSELAAILADPASATDCELLLENCPQCCHWYSRNAAQALRDKGDPSAIPALVAAVEDPDTYHDAAEACWEALERIGGPAVIEVLVEWLERADGANASGHALTNGGRAAEILGRIGTAENNDILVVALDSAWGNSSAHGALVSINRADATPLLKYLKSDETVEVYGPLISIGQAGTETALLAALKKFGDKDMAEAFLNSENPALEGPARKWAKAHGYTITQRPGNSMKWGSG